MTTGEGYPSLSTVCRHTPAQTPRLSIIHTHCTQAWVQITKTHQQRATFSSLQSTSFTTESNFTLCSTFYLFSFCTLEETKFYEWYLSVRCFHKTGSLLLFIILRKPAVVSISTNKHLSEKREHPLEMSTLDMPGSKNSTYPEASWHLCGQTLSCRPPLGENPPSLSECRWQLAVRQGAEKENESFVGWQNSKGVVWILR